jgi:inhibitor of cysteine peptidase
LLLLFLAGMLFACSPETEIETPQPRNESTEPVARREPAKVEAVEIRLFETLPVQVRVTIRGQLPDSCTNIDQISQSRNGREIRISVETISYSDPSCAVTRVEFEETVIVDITNLPAGHYVIDVNGLNGTFTLEEDNILDQEDAVISGHIREDICTINISATGAETVPSEGCIQMADGSFRANGLIDASEPGLPEIIVDLGAGICPSTGLATTITDGNGLFLFSGLKGGTYCVSIDEADERSNPLLAEGEWTYPLIDVPSEQTVILNPSESKLDLNFGWDTHDQFVFDPPDTDECTDKAIFKADVTIPDDTEISAGEILTKTWQLRNIGSCTWDNRYEVVSVGGESFSLNEMVPISATVAPGEDVNLSVTLIAPTEPGIYRSEWKLRNPDGMLFGIGPASNSAFWVQIMVVDSLEEEQ